MSPPPDHLEEPNVLDLLTSLVDKSLVIHEETPDGGARYRLLETVRQYAQEELNKTGDGPATRDRHLDFFLALAGRAEPELQRPDQQRWLELLEADHENLLAALRWCDVTEGGARRALGLAGSLGRFWHVHGHFALGRGMLHEALARAGAECPCAELARAYNAAGNMAWVQADYDTARALHEKALEVRRKLGDRQGVATSLNNLGNVVHQQGDRPRARSLYDEALEIYRALDDRLNIAYPLHNLGVVAGEDGDHDRAQALYEEALEINRALGHRIGEANTLARMGKLAHDRGDPAGARALHAQALAIRVEMSDPAGIADSLAAVACLAAALGDAAPAARLCGAAERLREEIGAPLPPVDRAWYDPAVAALHAALGEADLDRAWSEGRALSMEDAGERAVGWLGGEGTRE